MPGSARNGYGAAEAAHYGSQPRCRFWVVLGAFGKLPGLVVGGSEGCEVWVRVFGWSWWVPVQVVGWLQVIVEVRCGFRVVLEVPVLVRPGGSQRLWLGTGVVLVANRLQYHSSSETPMILFFLWHRHV